jgi:hypothetical protein
MLRWEAMIRKTIKFLKGWGKMITNSRHRREKEIRQGPLEIHTFFEKDLLVVC